MKFRSDFVTNSSSSSFVAYGIMSRELVSLLCEITGGWDASCSYGVGDISWFNREVVNITTELFEVVDDHIHLHLSLDEYDNRTFEQRRRDGQTACKMGYVMNAIRRCMDKVQITPEQQDRIKGLVKRAMDDELVLCEVYEGQTDGWSPHCFSSKEFENRKLIRNRRGEITAVDDRGKTPRTYNLSDEKLKSGLFRSCRNTEAIVLGIGAEAEKGALAGCVSLKRLDMSEMDGEIVEALCEGCTALETVELPIYAYCINERAFAGCKNLRDIRIPESVFHIHPTAFEGCRSLPEETRRVIASRENEKSVAEWTKETLAYVQSHGAAGFQEEYIRLYLDGAQKFKEDATYRTALAQQKRLCDIWWSVYGVWLDWPETLLKEAAYGVYAQKEVSIDLPRPQWTARKTIGKRMRYMIVDTENIPDLYRLAEKYVFGLEPRRPYNSGLDKAIELKKQGSGIQILTRAHFEKLVAAGAFVAPVRKVLTAQEATIGKQEQNRQIQNETFELVIQDVKDWCEANGEKLTTVGQMSSFAKARGFTMEKCRQIMQSRAPTAVEYLVQIGVYETPKMRFTSTVDALTAKYSEEKAKSIRQLEEENPELDISALQNCTRKFVKCTAREYLIQRGILYSDDELTELSGAQTEPKPEAEIASELREKMERTFAKLDEYYPDKVVKRLHNDHKKLGERVTELYRALGYSSGRAFLTAYGYRIEASVGGAPRGDHRAVIEELKRRYAGGARCKTLAQLQSDNPDLAPKFKSLSNQATELFGMPFAMYLRKIGVLTGWDKRDELSAPQKQAAAPSEDAAEAAEAAERAARLEAEALAAQKRREAARELELARQKTQLEAQRNALRKEGDAIKGLFAKMRKAKLDAQIAAIEAQLAQVEEELAALRAKDL